MNEIKWVNETARGIVARNDDAEKAAEKLYAAIMADDRRDEVIEPLVRIAARALVYDVRSERRSTVKMVPSSDQPVRDGNVILSAGERLRETFLKSWVVGNKSLGECTGAELREEAERERLAAKGHEQNATFYLALSKAVKDDEQVQSVMDDQTARKAWESVSRGERVTIRRKRKN